MDEMKRVRLDRMRYTKNSLSSNLALLSIVFNVLYFVSVYESDVGSWYYSLLIGVSIVYNLLFMLMAFLSSEGVKNYRIGYAWFLLALGAGQIARIFILPASAYAATVTIKKITYPVMQTQQFVLVVLWLCLSAACCFGAGVIGVRRSRMLSTYLASLDEKRA
ncbi:MAG: hypothetical protein IKU34_01285 [Clostridia bacterium]|nr:hypothetical protein [Clostridia bacterium]